MALRQAQGTSVRQAQGAGRTVAGHLAAAGAYAIFGLNIVFCKDIANASVITPQTLFGLRMIFATALFWLVSLFLPKEKVSGKDLVQTFFASMIGLVIPQMTFLVAITMASSIETSIMSGLAPVFTMLFAAIFLKEPITGRKAAGVAMSFAGVIFLIFSSLHFTSAAKGSTNALGIVLLLANAASFAAYLGIFRPLIQRYSVVTFMKWMFLFALLASAPFCWPSILRTDFTAISPAVYSEIAYLIVFATFVAYFLIPYGQQRIRPTLVSMYTYLQPIIAVIISVISGMDVLSWQKCLAIVLVFSGVAVVNASRSR